MNRNDVTEKIIATKVAQDLTWEGISPPGSASPRNGPPRCAWAR